MSFRWELIFLALVASCASARAPSPVEASPGVVFPVHFAEGHGDGALDAPLPDASGSPAPAGSAPGSPTPSGSAAVAAAPAIAPRAFTSDPPDPTPLRQAEQYEYTLRYANQKVEVVSLRPVRFPQPIVTARHLGRFAVELWIGHELVERVRFDFPLLAATDVKKGARRPLYEAPTLTGGPYIAKVLVPAAPRARRARLVDRAERTQAELSWPPSPSGLGPVTPMDPPPVNAQLAADPSAAAVSSPSGASPSGASPPTASSSITSPSITAPSGAATPPSVPPALATRPSSAAPAAAPPAAARPR